MIKLLSWWLKRCLISVTTLPEQDYFKTGTLGHCSNHIFQSQELPKYFSYEDDIVFSKCAKLFADCENVIKNWQKIFRFWHNGVWTLCENFSQIMPRIHMIGSQCVHEESYNLRSH